MRLIKYHSKNLRILTYLTMIVGVLCYTFVYSIQNKMHQTVPEAIGRHVDSMGIAISELKYGMTGYRGYEEIRNTLSEHGMTTDPRVLQKYGMSLEEILTDSVILNDAINLALNVHQVSRSGQYHLSREDVGLVTYYKLAFRIFGYKIESFLYLYFLLLGISVFVFLATFLKRVDLLNVLLLFVCSHFVIVAVAPLVGIQLQTVHNPRFLPVLGILPSLYIALLILGKRRFDLVTVAGASIQSVILILVINARSSAIWLIIFLCATLCAAVLWYWIRKRELGKYVFNKVHFWPLVIVFIGVFIFKMFLLVYLHPCYTEVQLKHLFWHVAYLGLSANPDSWSKYGIECDDNTGFKLVKKSAAKRYGIDDWSRFGSWELYEKIIKDEYMKILGQDPWFVVESYLWKPVLLLKIYFNSSFGAIHYLFKWSIIAILLLGSVMAGKVFLKRWLQYFCVLLIGFAFSVLPIFIYIPTPTVIADAAMFLTLLIYMTISGGMCYIFCRYKWFTMNGNGNI